MSSGLAAVTVEIPQGSILGPILFNLYVNDMYFIERRDNFSLFQWVDDTAFAATDDDTDELLGSSNFLMKLFYR